MKIDRPLPPIIATDDDENDLFWLRRLLREAGVCHPLVTFSDGMALTHFLQVCCESGGGQHGAGACLLFLDIKMPPMGGFEILDWIRKQPALNEMTIVMLSGSDDQGDRKRALESGANHCLVKYPRSNELAEIVRQACGELRR